MGLYAPVTPWYVGPAQQQNPYPTGGGDGGAPGTTQEQPPDIPFSDIGGPEGIDPGFWEPPSVGGGGESQAPESWNPPYNPWEGFAGHMYGAKGEGILSPTPAFGTGGGNYTPTPFGAGAGGGGGGAPPSSTAVPPAAKQGGAAAAAAGAGGPGRRFDFGKFLQTLQALMAQFGQGGPGPNVPDFSAAAIAQAEEERRRRGLAMATEAAGTGSAGSRDLGYRQSLLDEALMQSVGNIRAEQLSRQYAAELAKYNAEQQRFMQIWRYLAPLIQMFQGA